MQFDYYYTDDIYTVFRVFVSIFSYALCEFGIEEWLIICVNIINNCNRCIYALLTKCGVKIAESRFNGPLQ